jgi:MFS family permease
MTLPRVKDHGAAPLSGKERRLLLLLGVPSAGLSLCLTVLSTYLPLLARRFTSSTAIIGLLVGGEGLIAVLIPVWVGSLSDRTDTRFGRRLPFLLATAPIAALALGLVPFAPSLPVMAVEVFFFYLAYFTYFAPYQALYPDLVSKGASGRAQGIQGVFSNAGLGCALVGGGLLLGLWRPLPYLVAAATLPLGTAVLVLGLRGSTRARTAPDRDRRSPSAELRALLRGHPDIRNFVVGNALLMLALGGLKSFVVLWLTEGLGKSMTFTAGAMTVVALGTVVGAIVAGKLADTLGTAHVLSIALTVFGVGLAVGTFSRSVVILGAAFPIIALSGGAAIALPYALLMRLMPSGSHGTVAGLYDVSSGVGTLLGPAITGVAIDLLHPLFASTHGYAAMWPVLSVSVLASTVILRRAGALTQRPGSLSSPSNRGPSGTQRR